MCVVTVWLRVRLIYLALVHTDNTSRSLTLPLHSYRIVSLPFTRCANLVSRVGTELYMISQRLDTITTPLLEHQGPDSTPEKLDAECQAAPDFIDNGVAFSNLHSVVSAVDYASCEAEPLSDEEQMHKKVYLDDGFPDWCRSDFQQFVLWRHMNGTRFLVSGFIAHSRDRRL